jgi:hypothetical protein
MKLTVFQQKPQSPQPEALATPDSLWHSYWQDGKVEVSQYDLQKTIEDSIYHGEATLGFVNEELRTDTHLKPMQADDASAVSVLTLNAYQKFGTSSLMTSTFSPIDTELFRHPLKVSASVQNPSGQAYSQLDLHGRKYVHESKNYLEKNIQEDLEQPATWLEDEVWTRIRIKNSSLPLGEIKMIPSLSYSVVGIASPQATMAKADTNAYVGTDFVGKSLKQYQLSFKDQGRTVTIVFERAFPNTIIGWTEIQIQNNKTVSIKAILRR